MQKQTKSRITAVVVVTGLLLGAALVFANKTDDPATEETDVTQVEDPQQTPKSNQPQQGPRMDVAFVIDATGSMQDEIDNIKKEVWNIAEEIDSGQPQPDVRFGLVFYRDRGDRFVVRTHELTRDVDEIHEELMEMNATGGGDHREHVMKALESALALDWEGGSNVSRSMYLVGDAPAHDYQDNLALEGLVNRARDRNISINAIGCSGIDSMGGKSQFASIAERTSGTYEPLTYHAVVENAQGEEKSVVYYDGKYYEADEKLSDEEWSRGADELEASGRLEPTTSDAAKKAKTAPDRKNNLGSVVRGKMKDKAVERGVKF